MPTSTDTVDAARTALLREIADLRELVGWLDAEHQRKNEILAAELHDQLGSSLTALAMRLALIARQAGPEPTLPERWAKATTLLGTISQTARRVQDQLRPVALDALGLPAALADYLEQVDQRTGIACTLLRQGADMPLSLAVNQVLFRIVRDAVDNIVQHAGARSVQILLDFDQTACRMSITDDGCGIDLVRLDWQRSHGLRLMRERAAILQAAFAITSLPGQGCCITVTLPLQP